MKKPFILPIVTIDNLECAGVKAWNDVGKPNGGLILRGAEGLPTHERLLSFGTLLGPVRKSVLGIDTDTASPVHSIRPTADGIVDERGVIVRSTTFQDIPFHTDGYNAVTPPAIVLLQVHHPGKRGLTLVTRAPDIIAVLRERSVQLLAEPVFPSLHEPVPILRLEGQRWTTRFNFYEMRAHQVARHNVDLLTLAHVEAVSELDEVLDYEASLSENRIALERGDIMILDNTTTLNGRLALAPDDSGMLQHRLWCS